MNRYFKTRSKEEITLLDIMFFVWLTSEFLFLHTKIAQVTLLGFAGASFLDMVFIRKKMNLSYLYVFYGAFCVVAYLTTALGYSIDPESSGGFMRTLLINAVFIVAAYNYFVRTSFEKAKRLLIWCALASSIALTFMNFAETGSIFFRGSKGGYNPNSMAVFISYILSLIFCTTPQKTKWHWICIAILIAVCILASTRKAPLVIAIVILAYYCFKYPQKLPKYVLIFTLVAIVAYWLLINISFLYDSFGNRIESLINFLQGLEGDGSVESRSAYIELGMEYFKKSPLLGNGVYTFQTLDGSYNTYSHNNYVELLYSVGLIGTISYYFTHLITLIKGFFRYALNQDLLACVSFAFLVAYLVTDYALVTYYDRHSLIILVFAIAMLSNKREREL